MSGTDAYAESEELVPIGDVAKAMNVSVATVRNWERAGKITAIRTPGGQRRFTRSEIDRVRSGAA